VVRWTAWSFLTDGEVELTENATVVTHGRKWRRRAIIGIVILLLLSPLLAIRETREEYCPMCGRRGSSMQVWVVGSFTIRTSPFDCLGGDHAWFVNSRNTTPVSFSGGGMHYDAFLHWGAGTKFFLRPWFLKNPGGEDRRRVRCAIHAATRKQVDEILSEETVFDLYGVVLEGGDPGWSERLLPWADRVLARVGE